MIDVFAYLRVSGKSQIRGDGFLRQFIAVRKYCAANGLRIVRIFKERGVSGVTELDDRPALSELFDALEKNGIRTVVIEKLDRLARDLMVSETIIKDFQTSDYTLLSTCEPDLCSKDPSREFIRIIFAALAQLEKKLLVIKLRGARQRKKARGERGEGRHAFGEKPGEAEVLQEMLVRQARGESTRKIARALNSREILTRMGRAWVAGTVAKILARQQTRTQCHPNCA